MTTHLPEELMVSSHVKSSQLSDHWLLPAPGLACVRCSHRIARRNRDKVSGISKSLDRATFPPTLRGWVGLASRKKIGILTNTARPDRPRRRRPSVAKTATPERTAGRKREMVPRERIELSASPLPRVRSTTELPRHAISAPFACAKRAGRALATGAVLVKRRMTRHSPCR